MKRKTQIIFFLIVLFSVFQSGGQTNTPISVSSRVDKARILIGDLIRYSVTVTYDDSVHVEMPGFAANLGGFEIRDYDLKESRKADDKMVSEVSYIISTFLTGEFEIPPLFIHYTIGDDTTQHALMTESIKIVVESMKASEAGDIRDVKAPLEIPRNWWFVLRWPLLGLSLVLLLITGFILYRRHRAGKSLLPVREVPPRPAHEVALEALDRLTGSDLYASGKIKQFYIELSEIIREYINGRYFVVALEMTTTEVLAGLRRQDLDEEVFNLFRTFLNACDLVKFAKSIPSAPVHEETVQTAYQIIEKTKIVTIETDSALEPAEGDDASLENAGSSETLPEETVSQENDEVAV